MSDEADFEGVIGSTRADSEPSWPTELRARPDAPNVLIVLLDDVGFAQLGCFGSDLRTPHLDGLAADGLRYSNFHTTALCSPTRSCVLTGRNHHANGMGRIVELATGFPGYDAHIPRANGFLSEMLVPQGYAAWAVGKWHLTPEHEMHLGATRQRWPLGRGFERSYGFFGGETHQFAPALVHDNHFIDPPRTIEEGYHLTEDLADQAITFIHDLRAADGDKPFFLYFCPGACHSPHQAPADWLAAEKGRFDQGWDVWREQTFARQREMGLLPPTTELSERPDWVPSWDSLSGDERRLYARYMECFAAMLAHTDHQIGRIIGALEELGELENTIILAMSDNGASSEGGPTGSVNDLRPWNLAPRDLEEAVERIDEIGGPWVHNNYPWGWTVAGNTPFRRWKRETHEGGVADPLIVHWPAGIRARGELRSQYLHAVDLVPTVLDVLGLQPPESIDGVLQRPLDGVSLAGSFVDGDAPSPRSTQYYEMFGCRAIYDDGWKAVTYVPIADFDHDFETDRWELFHVAVDPSECHDLAGAEPDRLHSLVERWWTEARRNQVLPLDAAPLEHLFGPRPPLGPTERSRYVYHPGTGPVDEAVAADLRTRPHLITAEIDVPSGGVEGMLLAQGSGLSGWALYVKDDHLVYSHNFVGLELSRVVSTVPIPVGVNAVGYRFEPEGEQGGRGTLLFGDEPVGEVEIRRVTPTRYSLTGDGLWCGRHAGLPIDRGYRAPFGFTGTLHRVIVEVDGEAATDPVAEAEVAVQRQ